ncbi:MAG: hypothetical protein JXR73_11210, partial [Candidatus Omnitrophica bacterium]|nr:hypothetical protein [Candidatus Omnitrophota bacterium]
MIRILLLAAFSMNLACLAFSEEKAWAQLTDKTLVVWTAPADLDQTGGSALTIDDRLSHFDAIVFGELSPRKWMAGSDFFARTQKQQEEYGVEAAQPDEYVQIGIVYEGKSVTIYRSGAVYAAYEIDRPQTFPPDSVILFGKRHLDMQGAGFYQGKIADARIYDTALTCDQLRALKPNEPSAVSPWAWWSFADGDIQEKTGHYNEVKLAGDIQVRDGALVLGGDNAAMIAYPSGVETDFAGDWMKDRPAPASVITSARAFRNHLLADPYRPDYHFCVPED